MKQGLAIDKINIESEIKSSITQKFQDILFNVDFLSDCAPLLIFVIGGILTLLVGALTANKERFSFIAFLIALMTAFASSLKAILSLNTSEASTMLGQSILRDEISTLSYAVISFITLFTLVFSSFTHNGKKLLRYEMLTLFLFCSFGLMVMISAGEFATFFIGLEISSLSLYVLVGYQRKSVKALEAAIKYFILGGASAAMILIGAAFIYSSLGSLTWASLSFISLTYDNPLSVLGVIFFLSGLCFKIGLAPFHSWAPDVYQGANSHLTAFMASTVKYAVAIVFLRLLSILPESYGSKSLLIVFWIIALLSITIGSLFGMVQESVKRILAYSSIANAGYLCIAFATLARHPESLFSKQTLVSYAIIYAILSLVSFTIVAWIENGQEEDLQKDELIGLGHYNKFTAVAFSFLLIALAGLPPFAGFVGKYMLLVTALKNNLIGLAVILIMFSVFTFVYYISIISKIWFVPKSTPISRPIQNENEFAYRLLLVFCILLILAIGIIGPKWAFHLSYVQGFENSIRMLP